MDAVKFLAPIAARACHMEESNAQSIGEFLRMFCLCAGFDDSASQLLFEHILTDLVDTELISSCEFHEGLQGFLPVSVVIELITGAYAADNPQKFMGALVSLYSGEQLKPEGSDWRIIRSNLSALDFRQLLTQMMEQTCDKVQNIARVLSDVFGEDEYEIAETLRLVLDGHWILDVLPQRRKAAREKLYESFARPLNFTKKIVDDFCRDFLRLSPPKEKVASVSDASCSSSSDSDIESRGSLEGFVVDSEEEEDEEENSDGSDSSSEESEFSEDNSPPKRKRRH